MARRMKPTPERWLTIRQAHLETGTSRRTIYNWLAAGHLVIKRTASGSVRIASASLWREGDSMPNLKLKLKDLSYTALIRALRRIPGLDRDDRPYLEEAIRRLRVADRDLKENVRDERMAHGDS